MTSLYKLDTMISDVEPWLQLCFEGEPWDDFGDKIANIDWIFGELQARGIDDFGESLRAIKKLSVGDAFNEVKYFEYIEDLLNSWGYYTYNSDAWFEVYEKGSITRAMLEELET